MIIRKIFLLILLSLISFNLMEYSSCAYSKTTVRLMAAASLTESFSELINNFKKLHPEIIIEPNFAGSSQIVTQLENGIDADIVALASNNSILQLKKFKLVDSVKCFAKNTIIVAVSAKSKNILSLKDLLKPGVKIAIGIKTLPVGEYTYKILSNIDKAGFLGSDYSKKLLKNVVTNELDVKSIVNKVELGEVDAGFIYKTDVLSKNKSKIIILTLPKSVGILAEYPVAVVNSSNHKKESALFINYLFSDTAQKALKKFGFITIAK